MENHYKPFLIIYICLFFIFSISLKVEAGNISGVSASPNPFNPNIESTTISYTLTNSAILWIKIYEDPDNTLIRKLVTPANNYTENRSSGTNSDVWDGNDDVPTIVQEDTYLYHIDDIDHISTFPPTPFGNYHPDVVVDPQDSNVLYATRRSGTPAIRKSTNGGQNWTVVATQNANAYGIAISNDGKYIYSVSTTGSGMLYYSEDYGNTFNTRPLWSSPSVNNAVDIACSSDGTILYGIDKGNEYIYKSYNKGVNWGSLPQPPGTNDLIGIAVDPNDSDIILVSDYGADKVYKSTDGGITYTTVLSSSGSGDGQLDGPHQISIDSNGYYWVSEAINNRVQQFDSNNNWVMTVGGGCGTKDEDYQFNSSTAADCSTPLSLGIFQASFSGQPYLYVADFYNGVIKRFAYDNYIPSTDLVVKISDNTPPEAVIDMDSIGTVGSNYIPLTWTAPGDDWDVPGNTKAKRYDVRYSKTQIANDTEYNNATEAVGEPIPSVRGITENFTVTGLESNTIYYSAMKSYDKVLNVSDLSNSPSGKTGLLLDWNMVSCPLQPSPNDPNSVFGDDADVNWMWNWNSTWSGSGNPDTAGYWEQITIIVPGQGIFLYSLKDNDPTDATGTDITDASYTLSLNAGWNLIGNPYGTSVPLSNCDVTYTSTENYLNVATSDCSTGCTLGNDWIGNAIYIWNGNDYDFTTGDVAQLEPWKGYWILACCNLDLIIYKP